jgi:3-dehydroquinate dehydratase-1
MVRVGDISVGDGKPKICASITETDRKAVIAAADLLLQKRVDIIEWRIDFFGEIFQWDTVLETLQRLKMSLAGKPLLVTLRTKAEGGNIEISPDSYRELLEKLTDSGYVDMVDVEIFKEISYEDITASQPGDTTWSEFTKLQHWIEKIRQRSVVVGSYHNFESTPPDRELEQRLEIIAASGVDIPKIAVMPQNKMDVLRLMIFTLREKEKLGKPLITMSMSKLGSISRVSGESFGSSVTFGSIGQESAPGQIPVNRLEEMLEMIHQSYQ